MEIKLAIGNISNLLIAPKMHFENVKNACTNQNRNNKKIEDVFRYQKLHNSERESLRTGATLKRHIVFSNIPRSNPPPPPPCP